MTNGTWRERDSGGVTKKRSVEGVQAELGSRSVFIFVTGSIHSTPSLISSTADDVGFLLQQGYHGLKQYCYIVRFPCPIMS